MPDKVIDIYNKLFASLSAEEQCELISKLNDLFKNKGNRDKPKEKPDLRTCFTGDWSDIVIERHFNREVEEL